MAELTGNSIAIQPIIRYPREAQIGKTYLMTVDLRHASSGDDWPFEEEEYVLYCVLETGELFVSQPVGEPTVVLHRYGGTYGPARFLLTPAPEEITGDIRVTLMTRGGVPVRVLRVEGLRVVRQAADTPLVDLPESEVESGEPYEADRPPVEQEARFTQISPGSERVIGGSESRPIIPDQHYVQLWLAELRLQRRETWLSRIVPLLVVTTRVVVQGEEREIPAIFDSPTLALQTAPEDTLVTSNLPLMPLLPYVGGRYELSVALWPMEPQEVIARFSASLTRFSRITSGLAIPAMLQVAEALAISIPDLLSLGAGTPHVALRSELPPSPDRIEVGSWVRVSEDGVRLRAEAGTESPILRELRQGEIGLVLDGASPSEDRAWSLLSIGDLRGWVARELLNPVLATGFQAVLRAPPEEVNPGQLWVVENELRYGERPESSPPFDSLLLRIEAVEERTDWARVTSIAEPFEAARRARIDGDDHAKDWLRAAQDAAMEAPELSGADRLRIAQLLARELEEAPSTMGSGAMSIGTSQLGSSQLGVSGSGAPESAGAQFRNIASWVTTTSEPSSSVIPLAPTQIVGGWEQRPPEIDRHYVRLWLAELRLNRRDTWLTRTMPLLITATRTTVDGRAVELPILADAAALGLVPGAGDLLIARNIPLGPLVPLGSDLELELALLALAQTDGRTLFSTSLVRFAHLLDRPDFLTLQELRPALMSGVRDLLNLGPATLHLGLSQYLKPEELATGYLAVVRSGTEQPEPRSLWVVEDSLRQGEDPTSSQPVPFDSLLLRWEIVEARDDWEQLPSIAGPLRAALEAQASGDTNRMEEQLRRTTEAIVRAPELTGSDRERVVDEIRRRFDTRGYA